MLLMNFLTPEHALAVKTAVRGGNIEMRIE
jgi:hypothetical protein